MGEGDDAGDIPIGDINVELIGTSKHFKTTKDKEKEKEKKNVRVLIDEELSFEKKKTKEKRRRETHLLQRW